MKELRFWHDISGIFVCYSSAMFFVLSLISVANKSISITMTSLTLLLICLGYLGYKEYYRHKLISGGNCLKADVLKVQSIIDSKVPGLPPGFSLGMNNAWLTKPFKLILSYTDHHDALHMCESSWLYYTTPVTKERFRARIWVDPLKPQNRYVQLFYAPH